MSWRTSALKPPNDNKPLTAMMRAMMRASRLPFKARAALKTDSEKLSAKEQRERAAQAAQTWAEKEAAAP